MDCRLIFYSARKTSFCERSLKKSFSELDFSLCDTTFATDSVDLGNQIIDAFKNCNIVFVLGGLGIDGSKSTDNVLSRALADENLDDFKKLKNSFGDDGYIFRVQKQILVVLPDEPEQIETIMQGPLSGYIKKAEITRV